MNFFVNRIGVKTVASKYLALRYENCAAIWVNISLFCVLLRIDRNILY